MNRVLMTVAGVLLLTPALASAQGLVAKAELDVEAEQLFALQSLEVEASLGDAGGETREVRRYTLTSGPEGLTAVTATFYRPLTMAGASVSQVLLGGEEWAGKILAPAQADAVRKELALRLRDPAMLRDLGTPMFVSEPVEVEVGVFLPPVEVEVHLSQPLEQRGTMRAVSVPVDWHRQPAGTVKVSAEATSELPVRALYSPYHTLAVSRVDEHRLEGSYVGYQRCTAFEVAVLMSSGDEPVRVDVLAHRYAGPEGSYGEAEGTFMALISAPSTPLEGTVAARDIALVIDRSGSMGGEKMEQARAALTAVLSGLGTQDTFSLVAFDGEVEAFQTAAVPATPANIAAAQGFVEGLLADGGTNIHDALQVAFGSLPGQTSHPRYVVFLTDGQATAGETDTEAILAMARAHNEIGARIFTFGIGFDVNTILLDKLALESEGDAIYINPGQPVDVAVEGFFAQIVDPVLTDPALDVSGIGGSVVVPAALSDLFGGQTMTVLGRYTQPGLGRIVLSGVDAEYSFDVTLPAHSVRDGFVPRVWARRRVGELLGQIKLGDADPAIVAEALALAHRYGVVTDFTYFALDDEGDMRMTYSDVPVAAVGSAAVSTSTSIDAYQKGGSVEGGSDVWIRYHGDRTFPVVEGWFTDTALPAAAGAWVDVHFGSDLYWQLLADEWELGIGGMLGIGGHARFEFLGRRFRVTDSAEGDAPAESPQVPAPLAPSATTEVSVTASEETAPVEVGAPLPPAAEADPASDGIVLGVPSSGGCSTGAPGGSGGPFALLVLALGMVVARRRMGARRQRRF